jgi:methionyl-tRNA formyltransferase
LLAVVTNPDRPKGRRRRLGASPVKEKALAAGLLVLQPASVKESSFLERLTSLEPDLFVVVAYGKILSPDVLAIPRLGSMNVHASLLPKYRGAAPIQWAVINGEKTTGVTTMWMDEGMDTGDMLQKVVVPIAPDDTALTLHDILAKAGANLLMATLTALSSGSLSRTPQDHSKATLAPPLKKKDGLIEWSKDAQSLDCFVRGMYPWPGAFTILKGKRLKVLKVEALEKTTQAEPGTVLDGFPGDLDVATGSGILRLREVHLESGKRLPIREFLLGYPVSPGTRLGT